MRRTLATLAAAVALLGGCNQGPSVSLTNASPEEVAAKAKEAGVTTVTFHPGQWEIKSEITAFEMPGAPPEAAKLMEGIARSVPTVKTCMTPEQAKRPDAGMFGGKQDGKCTYNKFELSNGHIAIEMTCNGAADGSMHMTTNGDFSSDSYATESEVNAQGPHGQGMHMKVKASGRRVGDCPAGTATKGANS